MAFAIREDAIWGQEGCFQAESGGTLLFPPFPAGCDIPATFTAPRPPGTHQTRSEPRSTLIQYPLLSSELIFQMELMIWLMSVSLTRLSDP